MKKTVVKDRDWNIVASLKREVNMKSRAVAPKKGKGARYNRAKMKNSREFF